MAILQPFPLEACGYGERFLDAHRLSIFADADVPLSRLSTPARGQLIPVGYGIC